MKRSTLWLVLPVGLLVGLWILPVIWHFPVGVGAFLLLRWRAPELSQCLGRASRWAVLLLLFAVLGTLFGPTDIHWAGFGWSLQGGQAAITMMTRALALITLVSMLSSLLPLRSWLKKTRNTTARRLLGIIVVAANFVPTLMQALADARQTLRERRPGPRFWLQRVELLAVHTAVRAAHLAEEVAFDMTVATHNENPCK